MTAELRNVCRRLLGVRFAVQFVAGLLAAIARSLAMRLFVMPGLWLPDEVRRRRKALLYGHQRFDSSPTEVPPPVGPRLLALANGDWQFTGPQDWRTRFADDELTASLHRWGWLLRPADAEECEISADLGFAYMRSWLAHCGDDRVLARDIYSCGERIANGAIFALLRANGALPADLQMALRKMAVSVARYLEYKPAGQTGNHAFNNARALLFAGTYAEVDGACELAYAIAEERLRVLVTPEGFLREGSVHYHFLFTRWVLEMLWCARRYQRDEFVTLLRPYARALVEGCWLFMMRAPDGGWCFPLIGDVSPDVSPAWLSALPWSGPALEVFRPANLPPIPDHVGWAGLFGASSAGPASESVPASTASRDWLREDFGPWTVFLRTGGGGGVVRASHAHCDFGSFALYCEGAPVAVDPGRTSYTGDEASVYGLSADAHNLILIDGLAPAVCGPSWLPRAYRRRNTDVRTSISNEAMTITLAHDGYARRWGGGLVHQRTIELRRDAMLLSDHIEGAAGCRIAVRLHLADAKLDRDGVRWRTPRHEGRLFGDARLEAKRVPPPLGGIASTHYGRPSSVLTIELAGLISLPATVKQRITLVGS